MNTHPVTNEDVMAYLDGELSPEAGAEVTAHLAQCRACQDIAADLQGVSRQLSGWTIEMVEGDSVVPTNIATALATLAAAKTKKPKSIWSWRFIAQHPWAAFAAALVILVSGLIWTSAERRVSLPGMSRAAMVASESAAAPPRMLTLSTSAPADAVLIQPSAPLVVHTAELRLTARNFDSLRADLDRILLQFGGHIAQLNIASPAGEARSLTATLRIPAPQLAAALAELRQLGLVEAESQRGEEVTQQSVDLEARLRNSRNTEQRLTQILATRTGKLSEVLEVEQKLAEVRGMVEQAEAERKSLNNRISLATVSLQVSEDYRTPLAGTASPVGTRLNNAAVEGLRTAFNGFIGLLQALLAAGPSLLLFGLVLGLPAYFLWKKLRH
jgi:hypothetical protein